jgi:glycosyltransferase involved in cell wall biosynthesis
MKRIIIDARISAGKVGGVQTFIEGLASGFKTNDNYGFRRYWFVDSSDSSWISDLIPYEDEVIPVIPQFRFQLDKDNITSKNRNNIWSKRKKNLDAELPREPKVVEQLKPKFIQFCSQDAFLTNFPSIYHPHDLQHKLYPENFTEDDLTWRNLAWPIYANRARKIVVATDHVKRDLIRYFGIRGSKIVTISLTLNSFRSQQAPKWVLPKLSDPIYLIYPAAYYPHKNHEILIRAMPMILKMFPGIVLHFTGDEMKRGSEIKSLIQEFGVTENIIEHGWLSRPEFEKLMINARLLVVPSRYESASFPIDEAMSMGLPVVCSDIAPLRSQLGPSGTYFDPDSAFDVANKIMVALNSPIKTLGGDFQTSHSRTWGNIVEQYYKLYERL